MLIAGFKLERAMTGTIDDYLAALDEPRRGKLAAAIEAVRRAAPGAAESVQWGMPVFSGRGRDLALASQKSYISIYACSDPALAAELRAAEPRAKGGKACVNFTDAVDIPLEALCALARNALT